MIELKSATAIFVLLCTINMLNYIDRGIIPGSPLQFEGFISTVLRAAQHPVNLTATNATTAAPNDSESGWLGLLVSAFIVGYSVFSIAFGYWAIYYRPFVLIACGMSVWIGAMFLCGISDSTKSLTVLLIGRVLSGVGESSFQAIAPSFIDDQAPPAKRTLWLGIFYCGITVGTAAGYLYSTLFATSSLRWPWAFFSEGLLMIPLVLICIFCIPASFNLPGSQVEQRRKSIAEVSATRESPKDTESDVSQEISHECVLESQFSIVEQTTAMVPPQETEDPKVPLQKRVSLHIEIWEILKSSLYMLVALGSAAYVFSISGLGAFGPSLLIGMGLFEERMAAIVFGGIIVVAGTIGTLLGAISLDRNCRSQPENEHFRVYMATRQLCLMLSVGTIFLIASWLMLDHGTIVCISLLSIALTFLFGCVPASVVAIILSVEKRRRGLALGINTLLSHLLGDVPSPIVIGLIKDYAAPHCNIIGDNMLNPKCAQDRQGLKWTLLFPYLWLIWAIILSMIAVEVSRRRLARHMDQKPIEVEPLASKRGVDST
ncbi:Protein spinster 3 [Aphanomyces cochlioides]|nr:Protein spinster 3 [Aphanomyces cochlioides]